MKKLFSLLLIIFLLPPLQSGAWGVLGHRIVAQIAENHLTKKARKAVNEILGNESLAMVSNWADFIKSDPSMSYLSSWHYINVRGGISKEQFMQILQNDTTTNAYTKFDFIVSQIKNGNDRETKARYLKLLIHILGDLFQPLHVGRAEDRGGNNIKVQWFGDPANLHQVWDEKLINFQQLSYTEYASALDHVTKSQKQVWQKVSLPEVIYNGYESAGRIYSDIKPDDKLSYDHNFRYKSLLDMQLLQGGIWLAGFLNQLFS